MFKCTFQLLHPGSLFLPSPDTILLNIETTGLSFRNSFIFLAGTAGFLSMEGPDSLLSCTLLLCRSRRDEKDLLDELDKLCRGSSCILTYGGSIFTEKFIRERYTLYHEESESMWAADHMADILEDIRPLKKLLCLEDLKKKNVEAFAGYRRKRETDIHRLIQTYEEWENSGSEKARDILSAHNEEDILSLGCLSRLLIYPAFLGGNIMEDVHADIDGTCCTFRMVCGQEFPLEKEYRDQETTVIFQKNICTIRTECIRARLKYFLPGPVSDYYYLPREDMAVHKSVAQFVDAKFRKRASASTCYTAREGLFLPVDQTQGLPLFRTDHRSKEYYALCDPQIWDRDENSLRLTVLALIRRLFGPSSFRQITL